MGATKAVPGVLEPLIALGRDTGRGVTIACGGGVAERILIPDADAAPCAKTPDENITASAQAPTDRESFVLISRDMVVLLMS